MRVLLSYVHLFFLLLLFSCSKDSGVDAVTGIPQLHRILVNGVVTTQFSYNASHQLETITGYFGTGIKSSETIRTYDAAGKVTRIDTWVNLSSSLQSVVMDHSYSTHVYNSANRLMRTETYRPINGNNQLVSIAVPDYDVSGRTIGITVYGTNNQPFSKATYQYDVNDNVVLHELTQYTAGIQGPSFRYTYEYDSRQNPFREKWVMPFGANRNNITKQVVTNLIAMPGSALIQTSLTVYKSYSTNNYPTLVNENGVDYVYEYK